MTGQRRRTWSTAALAAALLLAPGACAKRHLYPGDRLPDDKVATIEAERFLLADVAVAIDDKPAGSLAQYYIPPGVAGGFPPGAPTTAVSVLPGSHRLSMRVANYGWLATGEVACAAADFQAAAGRRYKLFIVNGRLVLRDLASNATVAEAAFAGCPQQARAARPSPQRSSTLR